MRCKHCKEKFEPKRFLQKYCDKCVDHEIKAAIELSSKKKRKVWVKKKKALKDALKTKQNYEKELEKVFNDFIRLRDKNKPCISCGTPLVGKFDAGHFFPVGSYKNLRFDESNVHGQCVYCNQHQHGNLIEYGLNLPNRIGQEMFDNLTKERLVPKKYTIPELILMKEEYKKKIKALLQDQQ